MLIFSTLSASIDITFTVTAFIELHICILILYYEIRLKFRTCCYTVAVGVNESKTSLDGSSDCDQSELN